MMVKCPPTETDSRSLSESNERKNLKEALKAALDFCYMQLVILQVE
jgi:hypothetical protein